MFWGLYFSTNIKGTDTFAKVDGNKENIQALRLKRTLLIFYIIHWHLRKNIRIFFNRFKNVFFKTFTQRVRLPHDTLFYIKKLSCVRSAKEKIILWTN